jgi:hypothetical protein
MDDSLDSDQLVAGIEWALPDNHGTRISNTRFKQTFETPSLFAESPPVAKKSGPTSSVPSSDSLLSLYFEEPALDTEIWGKLDPYNCKSPTDSNHRNHASTHQGSTLLVEGCQGRWRGCPECEIDRLAGPLIMPWFHPFH